MLLLLSISTFLSIVYGNTDNDVTRLGFSILRNVDSSKNIVISPLAAYVSLTRLYLAADGKTKDELENVLFSTREHAMNASFYESIHDALEFSDSFGMVNQMYLNKTLKKQVDHDYEQEIMEMCMTPLEELTDFSTINAFIRSASNFTLSRDLLGETDNTTLLALTNAFYMNGELARSAFYEESLVADWLKGNRTFHGLDGDREVFMTTAETRRHDYVEHSLYTFTTLEYGSTVEDPKVVRRPLAKRLRLAVIIPKNETTLEELIESFANGTLEFPELYGKNEYNGNLDVTTPLFTIESHVELSPVLESLGVDMSALNLSAMFQKGSATRKLQLNIINQAAKIDIRIRNPTLLSFHAFPPDAVFPLGTEPLVYLNVDRPFLFGMFLFRTLIFLGTHV